MRTIKDKVIYVLQNHEETRNSDKYLYAMFIWEFHRDRCVESNGKVLVAWEAFFEVPDFKSIIRIRQKLQELGMFLPTSQDVRDKRKTLERNIRETINTFEFDTYLT